LGATDHANTSADIVAAARRELAGLRKQSPARSIAELQFQLDGFLYPKRVEPLTSQQVRDHFDALIWTRAGSQPDHIPGDTGSSTNNRL
jgi:hypothetical protein